MHCLKCWPEPFTAILEKRKYFEVRKNDRGFMVGDFLQLEEWDPGKQKPGWYTLDDDGYRYTGRRLRMRVTYILQGTFGLPPDLAVMSLEPVDTPIL